MKLFIEIPDETKESGYRLLILNFGEASPNKSDLVDSGYNALVQQKKEFVKNTFSKKQLKDRFMFTNDDVEDIEITNKFGTKRYEVKSIVDSFKNKKGYKVKEER